MESIYIGEYETEFYSGAQSPVRYLDNVKQVNLFIGANNTRKSRFLRRLIQLERKTIIRTKKPLNEWYSKSEQLIKELTEDVGDDVHRVLFKYRLSNSPPIENERFGQVYHFFQAPYLMPINNGKVTGRNSNGILSSTF